MVKRSQFIFYYFTLFNSLVTTHKNLEGTCEKGANFYLNLRKNTFLAIKGIK